MFAPGLVIKVKSPLRANHSSGIGAAVSRDSAKFLRRSHDAVIHVYDAGNARAQGRVQGTWRLGH
jgi:hypothetical protein